jgi:hypothetical protein
MGQRVGRSDAYASSYDLERKELVQTVTLGDFDAAAWPQGGQDIMNVMGFRPYGSY